MVGTDASIVLSSPAMCAVHAACSLTAPDTYSSRCISVMGFHLWLCAHIYSVLATPSLDRPRPFYHFCRNSVPSFPLSASTGYLRAETTDKREIKPNRGNLWVIMPSTASTSDRSMFSIARQAIHRHLSHKAWHSRKSYSILSKFP